MTEKRKQIDDIISINEMGIALDDFASGKLTKSATLKKILTLAEEMQEPKQPKPKTAPKNKPATIQAWPEKLAAGAKDFLFNPARNKNKPFGGGGFG